MASVKYSRVDGRKSSGYWSTVTIVVFVALCLVGVWMMTSSSLVPVQNVDVSQENKDEVKTHGTESNAENNDDAKNNENRDSTIEDNGPRDEGKQKQFEDNQGDLPEDAIKGDDKVSANQVEKNETPEEMEKNDEKSGDKTKGDEVENKEDGPIDESENGEQKKVDGELQVENKDSEPGRTIEKSLDDNEKRTEEISDKTDAEKQEGQVEQQVEQKVENEKDEKPNQDDNEKRSEENLDKTDVNKQEGQMEEKVENKKGEKPNQDDDEKRSEENLDKTDVNKLEGQMDEMMENKKDDKLNQDDNDKRSEEKSDETDVNKQEGHMEEKVEYKKDETPDQSSTDIKDKPSEMFPSGAQSEILNESTIQNGSFSTQATESKNEKEAQKSSNSENQNNYSWKLCKTTAGTDYIPCLDNLEVIKKLRSTKHYEHRERHCPDNPPTCLVPVPKGFQRSIEWPTSREKIWYHNVPHTKLAAIKGHQNWVKVSGEYLTFPGGGTQFKHGALHYIDFIQQSVPEIAWGKHSRVVLDVGCGVASFGGFLFDRDALTMSLAPKDEHEAQVQFALERGIPAISAVMGTKRLPYPARVFDVVHCARCRVPWHIEGGKLLLELNRLLRPGGFFVWSATPIYQKLAEDVEIWEAMKKLTKAMCWEVVSITKDRLNGVGIAIYHKPTTNECYDERPENDPPMCPDSDDPDAAWNVPLQACMHKLPVAPSQRGSQWPEQWPARVGKAPYWLSSSEVGVYGKPAPEDFMADYKHWKRVVNNSYLHGLGINWSTVRNVMDMRAVYGGLAAALRELNIWVMNIVSVDAPDTLPIIYERGLFGIYHDWCESFSTYPRSYDLLHADHLFSKIKKKCNFIALVSEADRILRPEGKIIVRDKVEVISELENIFKSLHWDIRLSYSKDKEGLIFAQKTMWRPKEEDAIGS